MEGIVMGSENHPTTGCSSIVKYYPPRFLFRRYELLKRIGKGENFLEIGPGKLYLAQELLELERFQRGTVVDRNPLIKQVYDSLPSFSRQRLDLVIADFINLRESSIYDCVIACEVLEHIVDDEVFLDKVYNFLKPYGQVIISVPSRMKFWSLHDELVGHLRRYEKDNVIQILSDRGFANINIISYGFPFVNLLRYLRIFLTRFQYKDRRSWSQVKKTHQSGVVPSMSRFFGLICNPYTCYLFNLIASLFNDYDLSDGYILTAEKQ
jgi:SAM-dependent methyltransferase